MPQGFLIRFNSGTLFTQSAWQWLPGSGSGPIFGSGFPGNGFRIQAARLRYLLNQGEPVNVQMRFVDGSGSGLTDWVTVTPGGQETFQPADPIYVNSFDVTRDYRVLWASINRGPVAGLQIIGPSDTRLELEAVYEPEPMDVRSSFGGYARFGIAQASTGTAVVGDTTRYRTIARSSGTAILGGETLEGSIFGTSGTVLVGDRTSIAVYWPTRGRVALGGATRDKNRFVVPLRLKAGMVDQDVGYMWVPVYLQLPEDPHVADWPWEFYYPNGRKIPFMRRNRVAHQVRALCYMRPSVTQTQEFYCRVG
jgi:hypothetical protein